MNPAVDYHRHVYSLHATIIGTTQVRKYTQVKFGAKILMKVYLRMVNADKQILQPAALEACQKKRSPLLR